MAITGTVAYQTTVTLSAPGGTNADATAIAAAFNGIVFPTVSNTAATASASTATVTITWPQTTERIADQLVRDFVATQVKSMASTLNAAVTGIQAYTTVSVS